MAMTSGLKEQGLLLNEDKRFFLKDPSADGILPDQDHTDAVLKAPLPSDALH